MEPGASKTVAFVVPMSLLEYTGLSGDFVIKPVFIRFAFPPRWHYDILRALDHFQAVNAPRYDRLAEAIEIVRSTRREDGRWSLQKQWTGKTYSEMERLGVPSRWNTLRALRVLKWWDGRSARRRVNDVGAGHSAGPASAT
jgi:hypothetical protein